jgi:hypothetical protein
MDAGAATQRADTNVRPPDQDDVISVLTGASEDHVGRGDAAANKDAAKLCPLITDAVVAGDSSDEAGPSSGEREPTALCGSGRPVALDGLPVTVAGGAGHAGTGDAHGSSRALVGAALTAAIYVPKPVSGGCARIGGGRRHWIRFGRARLSSPSQRCRRTSECGSAESRYADAAGSVDAPTVSANHFHSGPGDFHNRSRVLQYSSYVFTPAGVVSRFCW